ncbi:acyltransferase family protein [Niabella drilacis]|uniref:Peptidoglycan/LPS O-acetylase OafA/YrhL, contains acyltransferase and SGNH-hydrolase domains n=1 Tax=Niabella drilacis (strain DSM 25811 / CCM 8410 / CCUG 62505 / LMG 26954 / E90) TaxID=1285928 RepID=A0A1G6U598_NIADE|nr:acyltransferase [Niabella drilacis]SDD36560.1 Peptidoglycan/LPS O-acetylase OafA/YrhL, contains acyltransferase and SGNH-hydrolase domains [Niabella drilacis]
MASISKSIYFPQLDVLRGIAFLLIFFFHAWHPENGSQEGISFLSFLHTQFWMGIEIFFILSSFLLTLLGLYEYEATGRFSLLKFFTRRVLRIWPLYFAFLAVAFFVLKPVSTHFGDRLTLPAPLFYVLFISNFYAPDHVFFLRILWSISVEEQFYVILGFALKLLHRKLSIIFVILLFTGVGFILFSFHEKKSSYFSTLNYFLDFSVGGLTAIVYKRFKCKIGNFFDRLPSLWLNVFYCYIPFQLVLFYMVNSNQGDFYLNFSNRCLIVIYTGLFILERLSNKRRWVLFSVGRRFLIFTGKISYGLYVFHGLAISITSIFIVKLLACQNNVILILISLCITYTLAVLSFYFFEAYFLRLKSRIKSG